MEHFTTLEMAVARAQAGDRPALEHVVANIQNKIYSLALRMLWHPEDARDATQEILIRIITHLGSFRGESALMTWVYRVAARYLLRACKKSRLEAERYSFQRFGAELDAGLSNESIDEAEHALLLEEIKIGCTLGMLLCLDRPHRLAYILGDILELPGGDAAIILGVTPAAFRKRLSRARSDIVAFMQKKCGLVEPQNACRCRRRVQHALQNQSIDPDNLLFAHDRDQALQFPAVLKTIRTLEAAQRTVALYRTHPEFFSPENFVTVVKNLIGADD